MTINIGPQITVNDVAIAKIEDTYLITDKEPIRLTEKSNQTMFVL
jgi:hypothetical protein